MKITLPENISEIKLEQFQRYVKLLEREDLDNFSFNKRKIEIFTNISYHDLDNIEQTDFTDILKQIDIALDADVEFENIFTMNGIEFGFIPNLNNMSTKEFIDLSLYPLEDVQTFHKMMAILYRPVTKKDALDNYDIELYNGTNKYAEIMKQTPMHIVNGTLGFFLNLSKELQNLTQRYMLQALKKGKGRQTSLQTGDGTQPSLS